MVKPRSSGSAACGLRRARLWGEKIYMSMGSMKENELATLGLSAYQEGDYETAIKFFTELSKRDSQLWDCRLYLGMAYCKTQNLGQALQEFMDITQFCPDPDLKAKALAALRAMNTSRTIN